MANAAKILERVRALGANVLIDGGKLVIVNRGKLPAEAMDYIRQNGRAIADYLDKETEFEERAAIIEFDGGAPRDWAEQFARVLIQSRPANVSDLDWSWFITQCGRIIDEAPERRAA